MAEDADDDDVAVTPASTAAALVPPLLPPLSRRTPLCSYAPPSLAGAPTALLKRGKTLLDVAAERIGDWGSGFGGFLVVDNDNDEEENENDDEEEEEEANENERRRRRAATASCSSSSLSPCDLFGAGLVLRTATRQATHELAGKGTRSAVAARDAAFHREYATFLAEVKASSRGLSSASAENAAAAAAALSSALLTRESVVAGKRVPLAKLFRVVQRLGGHAKVAEGKSKWRDVLRAFEVRRRGERERERKKTTQKKE